jgi:hypothetical protein
MYFCNVKCKADWQRTQKPVDKEWLVKKYTDERLDATQIGMLVGRDAKSVWNWLVGYGIPTRRRGYASSEHWMAKGDISLFKGKTHSNETKNKLRQIAIADGRVPFNKEKGPFYKGKRGSDIPSWKGGVTPERQAFYSAIEWKKVVREVWVRDNATCQRCKVRKSDDRSLSFDIHHIVSFAFVGLRSELSNLVLLCEPCHYWVHSSGNIDKLFIKKEPSNG